MNVVKEEKRSNDITKEVAEIDGKFYPYLFDISKGQVSWGSSFARYTESGVKYVSRPYQTIKGAWRARNY